MSSKSTWAKAITVGTAFTLGSLSLPIAAVNAQESPSVALEQARRGEDGVSGAGATSGNLESGSAKRDKDGNGGTASAGGSGEVATGNTSTDGAVEDSSSDAPPPPANADLLSALGILDDVTIYGIDVLSDSDIPLALLPVPTENSSPSAPSDVNTGGQGSSGEAISTDPGAGSAPADAGSGDAPAGGSTASAAEDGTANSGGKKKDKAVDGTNGGTETSTAAG
jgi:hypothetical protein